MEKIESGTGKAALPPILLPFVPIHKRAMGLACGLVLGGLSWLLTVAILLKHPRPLWPNLGLLSQFMYGYRVSWLGSLIGLAWGFAFGYAFGWSFAALHNLIFRCWLAVVRARAEKEEYSDLLDRL